MALEMLMLNWSGSVPDTEYSKEFIQGVLNRAMQGFFSYGAKAEIFPSKKFAIDNIRDRLKSYEQTHNTEYLMDVACFAMIEFMHPKFRDAFFKATSTKESQGSLFKDGSRDKHRG